MLLFVGLGNPGPRYAETPHNAGFVVCDRFAARHRFAAPVEKYQGVFARGKVGAHDVGVLRPQTFMNLSGQSVAAALRYLPVEPAELVVVFDEMDIPSGKLRLRKKGGHGGHNGLRSIIEQIGTSDFPRIRVGHRPSADGPRADRPPALEGWRRGARAIRRHGRARGRRARHDHRPGLRGGDEPIQRAACASAPTS